MATTFTITIASDDHRYARQAAQATFDELDRIEGRLSRYVENSDVSRVNHLQAGQISVIHPDTFDCLRIALEAQRATDGAFDVAYASRNPSEIGSPFRLDSERNTVRVLRDGLLLDLGGIGKGFALDRMAEMLKDWVLESVLLAASTSTLLAGDPPPGDPGWPFSIGPRHDPYHLKLANRAVSGSGTAARGHHIMDPKNGQPSKAHFRAWAIARTAAMADALSTAFMVMPLEKIEECCRRQRCVRAFLLESPTGSLVAVGDKSI
jgi:thiamine biosynthesis lipoprotein